MNDMSFTVTLNEKEFITLDFLMSDYESLLKEKKRDDDSKLVQNFMAGLLKERCRNGNSFEESIHKFSVDNSNSG